MNKTPIIEIEEFGSEEFELNYHPANSYESFYIKGTTYEEKEEDLWGDQVRTSYLVAKVNEITKVVQFDEEGEEMDYVELELARLVMEDVKEQDEVLASKSHSINYNL